MIDIDLTSPELLADPYPTYAQLRDEAPVYRHKDAFIMVSRYKDVIEVLRSPQRFSSSPMGGLAPYIDNKCELRFASGSLIGCDPPVHTRQRKLVSKPYQLCNISAIESRARELAHKLIDRFPDSGCFDLMSDFSTLLPGRVGAEILGIEYSLYEQMRQVTSGETRPEQIAGNRGNIRGMAEGLTDFLNEKRRNPGDDMISSMLAAEREGKLSSQELHATAALLLVSGSEETPALMGNTLLALLNEPSQLAEARSNPELIPAIIEEALRFDSPVQIVTRIACHDDELAGQEIRQGEILVVILGSANRDPERFPDPDRFNTNRDTKGHLGFGASNHICLGLTLAQMTTKVMLESLLSRFPVLERASDEIVRHPSLLIRGPVSLPLRYSEC